MPNWTPAEENGKKVAVLYNLPVNFTLPKTSPDDKGKKK
jgi:hypothetical protein